MNVGNYNFELRSFKYSEFCSEETNCFQAVLYVNGRKFAYCRNAGYGGPTEVDILPQCKVLGEEIHKFLKEQPKIKYEDFNIELERNLEYIVDELVTDCLRTKEEKRIMNKTKKSLVFKDAKGDFILVSWKGMTIETMLMVESGRNSIIKAISEQISEGHTLINDNIPSELLPKL